MKAIKNQDDFLLSIYPVEVTVGDLKSWIAKKDEESKRRMADFIYHRLNHRYIRPLLHIPQRYKSGFLMMASACLMIETLQCFHSGKKDTKGRGMGLRAFKEFFQREKKFFPLFAEDFADEEDNFYTNIRCGILHQAETKRGWRILRLGQDAPLLDAKARTINANAFLAALERCLEHYVDGLRATKLDSEVWEKAIEKLGHISDNCSR